MTGAIIAVVLILFAYGVYMDFKADQKISKLERKIQERQDKIAWQQKMLKEADEILKENKNER